MQFQDFDIKFAAKGEKTSETLPRLVKCDALIDRPEYDYDIVASGVVWGHVRRARGEYFVYDAVGELAFSVDRYVGVTIDVLPHYLSEAIRSGALRNPEIASAEKRMAERRRSLTEQFILAAEKDVDRLYADMEKAQAALPPDNMITRILSLSA